MKNYSRIISLITLIIIFLFSMNYIADAEKGNWHVWYDSALKHIEKEDYSPAIDLLKKTIDLEPIPESGKRATGSEYIDYYPYYYLGLCYFKTNNYSEADNYLKKSRSEGAIRANLGLYNNLKDMIRQIIRKGRTVDEGSTGKSEDRAGARGLTIARHMKDGRSLYREEKYEEAAEEFRKALAEDNRNKSAKDWLQKAGNKLEAENLTEEGDRLYSQGKYEEALIKYRRASRLDPGSKAIKSNIKKAQLKADQEVSTTSIQKEIDDLFQAAFNYYKQGDYVNAKVNFEKVLEKDPANEKAEYYVTDCNKKLSAQADSEESRKKFNRFIGEAEKSMDNGNLTEAKDYLDKASALRNNTPEVKKILTEIININHEKMKLGFTHYIEGEIEESERILSECAMVDDSSPGLLAFLGSLIYTRYILTEEKNDNLRRSADRYFKSALRKNPDYILNPKIFSPRVIAHFKELKSNL